MGRRVKNRIKAVFPVRMSGTDTDGKPFSQMVHTLDISSHGARLGGFKGKLKAGDTVSLQYRNFQVRHRICWLRPLGEHDMQLGVESLQPEKQIWGVKSAADYKDDFFVALAAQRKYERRANDRRKYTRFPVSGVVVVSNPVGEDRQSLRVTDISLEGCFIETGKPFDAGARVKLLLRIQDAEIETLGTVRASLPNSGMGVEFTHLGSSELKPLYTLIRGLAAKSGGATASAEAPAG